MMLKHNVVFIFGKTVHLRPYQCSPTGGLDCNNSKVNLYIYASGFCPAKCSFCPGYNSTSQINIDKLKVALSELHQKRVINRIHITGGEPLSNIDSFNQILKTINDVCGKDYIVAVNTNGINLSKLHNIDYFPVLNDIHISRHSENDNENNDIFGIRTPTISQIKELIRLNPKYSFSCNLLKGYVDSHQRLQSYLDVAIDLGIKEVGFVFLMNKTSSCKDNFIDYEEITSQLKLKDGFLFENISKDKTYCKCENYSYYNNSGEIKFYLRRVISANNDCAKCFIFNEDKLTTNFNNGLELL